MAATPETKAKKVIKDTIKRVCESRGFPYLIRTNAAGGIGFSTGIADMTLLVKTDVGMMVADIEVKAGRNTPTDIQVVHLKRMHAVGGSALVVWGDDANDMAAFTKFLTDFTPDIRPWLKLERTPKPTPSC